MLFHFIQLCASAHYVATGVPKHNISVNQLPDCAKMAFIMNKVRKRTGMAYYPHENLQFSTNSRKF